METENVVIKLSKFVVHMGFGLGVFYILQLVGCINVMPGIEQVDPNTAHTAQQIEQLTDNQRASLDNFIDNLLGDRRAGAIKGKR